MKGAACKKTSPHLYIAGRAGALRFLSLVKPWPSVRPMEFAHFGRCTQIARLRRTRPSVPQSRAWTALPCSQQSHGRTRDRDPAVDPLCWLSLKLPSTVSTSSHHATIDLPASVARPPPATTGHPRPGVAASAVIPPEFGKSAPAKTIEMIRFVWRGRNDMHGPHSCTARRATWVTLPRPLRRNQWREYVSGLSVA